jgi:hypothetical protein
MHLNREYVYDGRAYVLSQLFSIETVDHLIDELDTEIEAQIRTEFQMLDQEEPPEIVPGRQCAKPVVCEFFDRCNAPKPMDHISNLPGIRDRAIQKLLSLGIESIYEIPPDFPFSDRMRRACTCVQRATPWFSSELAHKLEELRYPVYFMDFETVNPAIPRFAEMRPFDVLPFQWPLHIQESRGANLRHFEFLAATDADPRRNFVEQLCPLLRESGSIVVYHKTFESERLADLAGWIPEFAPRIDQIQRRLWDLLPVVRSSVYHPEFEGSFSLKAVIPALLPELSYEGMEVADGTTAGRVWESILHGSLEGADKTRLRDALLAYCGQDTLVMVRLVERLREALLETCDCCNGHARQVCPILNVAEIGCNHCQRIEQYSRRHKYGVHPADPDVAQRDVDLY